MSAPALGAVDVARQLEAERFLYEEAALLDERRFDAWLSLVADDIVYRMPAAPPDDAAARSLEPPGGHALMHFEDDHAGLAARVARLGSKSAWSEQPPPLTRRAITNVRVYATDDDALEVHSNFMLYQYQRPGPVDLLAGRRRDVLRRGGDGLRLHRRTIWLDQRVLVTRSVSVLF